MIVLERKCRGIAFYQVRSNKMFFTSLYGELCLLLYITTRYRMISPDIALTIATCLLNITWNHGIFCIYKAIHMKNNPAYQNQNPSAVFLCLVRDWVKYNSSQTRSFSLDKCIFLFSLFNLSNKTLSAFLFCVTIQFQ